MSFNILGYKEADASLDMEHRHFVQASLEYVFLLQEVQERKKFEFVEIILSHTYSWLTFYHQGHEVYNDYKNYMTDLQQRIQRIQDPGSMNRMFTRQGYLYLMEKKAFGTTNWTKYYCYYQKETKEFRMIPYNQIQQKLEMTLKSCVRRSADSIDKRFCLDLTVQMHDKEKGPTLQVLTMQTLSEEDCKRWMDAMDGKEPIYACPSNLNVVQKESTLLDEFGLNFISKAIAILESKGLEDQGLYRLVGVSSKVTKLLNMGLDPNKADKLVLEDPAEWEVKTITSAIKQYFRTLPEPLMTYDLHNDFIAAAKKANAEKKEKEKKERKHINLTHQLVHKLPETNFKVLKTLIQHLCNVAKKSDKNLMTVSNLGVCFGPTLLRPEEESVAAIMDIKFCNIVVEILIEHFDTIFNTVPPSPLELLPSEGPLKQNSLPSGSSSSTPKSSPTPTAHSPSGGSTSNNQHLSQGAPLKANQPVLQTVVTSFTTSEPQTVHFGNQQQQSQHQQQASNTPGMLRSEATSNLKNQSGSHANHQHHHSHFHHSNRPPGGGGGVPPPPSSTHIWPHGGHSASTSSLNSGIVSQTSLTSLTSGVGSLYDVVSSSNNNINLSNNNPLRASTRPSGPTNGRLGGPLSFVNPLSDRGEGVGSSSSSCESLSSRSSRDLPLPLPHPPQPAPTTSLSSSSSPQTSARLGTAYPPTYKQHMETKRVRTLYACVGENDSELSFEPNQILTNVRPSKEPGWLEGTLNGRHGLIPENYVEYIDDKGSLPTLISQRNTDV
ncbi:Rho GTPase-activating protein 26 [Armadillidium nasatum]|uniref:Rho GTPase-activating protein 26 n=1 Tax=Armadillidium nasatum TaxID=96803 RepID=A0A5N5TPE9_9CRUS|nr:Rho GTPase-activating protein 26 [Armadillidium nasatum]